MSDCQTPTRDGCGRCFYNAKCVIYKGQNLSNLHVYKGDNLQYILQQINNYINGGGTGTITGASNIGAGEGVFAQVDGSTLEFKSLLAGYGIILSSDSDEITIEFDTSILDGQYWKLTGNSSTDPSVNFLGTTDNKGLLFKVNNYPAGYINTGTDGIVTSGGYTSFGQFAGNNLIPLIVNGTQATGRYNTLLGHAAGYYLGTHYDTTGSQTISGENVFVGNWAGFFMQHIDVNGFGRNVFVGQSAGFRGIAAGENTGVGCFALEDINKGIGNTAVGRDSLRSLIDGYSNTAVGIISQTYGSTGIKSISVTNGGTGYTTATVTISAPYPNGPGTCYAVATATAIIENGSIDSIQVNDPGCGYSEFGGTFYTGFFHPPVVVTITGDGNGATATANLQSNTGNSSLGVASGLYNRLGRYNTYLGYYAGSSLRYYDENNTFVGASSGIHSSVAASTFIEKSTAIGYNAKVSESSTVAIGDIGVKCVIGGSSARATLDVIGDVAVETISNNNSSTNLISWNSTTKLLEYRTVSSLISGTANFIPVFNSTSSIITSRFNQYALNVGGLGIDDLTSGITTTNPYSLVVRNAFVGDVSATQAPMILTDSTISSVVNLNVLQMSASSAATGSIIKYTLGRSMSTRNMFFTNFNYVGNGSAGNYIEEIFFAGTTVLRKYASGNTVFGSSSDSGYKVDVSGEIRSTLGAYFATSSGNVGIGTASTTEKLTVNGNIVASAPTYSSGGYDVIVRNQSSGRFETTTVSSGGYTVHSITSADSPYTISETSGDIVVLADTTSGNITINFSTAVGNTARYSVKKISSDANSVTIDGYLSETIDNSLTVTILFQYSSVVAINDNSNWYTLN